MYFPPFHAIGSVLETFHVPGLLYMQGPQMAVVRSVQVGSRQPMTSYHITTDSFALSSVSSDCSQL